MKKLYIKHYIIRYCQKKSFKLGYTAFAGIVSVFPSILLLT